MSCNMFSVEKVIYASTSCVMAGNELPWKEDEKVGYPLNPYGYTKLCNESQFMASAIPSAIGLRFFTVVRAVGVDQTWHFFVFYK